MNTFYIHFKLATLEISSISGNNIPKEEYFALPVDGALGLQLIQGEKNLGAYCVLAFANNTYELHEKKGITATVIDRIEQGAVYEVTTKSRQSIHVVLNKNDDVVEVHYNADVVKEVGALGTKIYFTKEDDISFLKCALSLDVNTLNSIKQDLKIDYWPNPILLKLDSINDISVFGLKYQPTISIETKQSKKKNAKKSNKRI